MIRFQSTEGRLHCEIKCCSELHETLTNDFLFVGAGGGRYRRKQRRLKQAAALPDGAPPNIGKEQTSIWLMCTSLGHRCDLKSLPPFQFPLAHPHGFENTKNHKTNQFISSHMSHFMLTGHNSERRSTVNTKQIVPNTKSPNCANQKQFFPPDNSNPHSRSPAQVIASRVFWASHHDTSLIGSAAQLVWLARQKTQTLTKQNRLFSRVTVDTA